MNNKTASILPSEKSSVQNYEVFKQGGYHGQRHFSTQHNRPLVWRKTDLFENSRTVSSQF